jgi:branched-chain amino acid transport system ATP-binding protein
MILELRGVSTYYGVFQALFGVSLTLERGSIVSLLGRNGAGKTTTMHTIMGLTPARAGQIVFTGHDITRWPPHAIARQGIGFIPEGRRIFPDLTVRQNLAFGQRLGLKRAGTSGWSVDKIYALFPPLRALDTHLGGHLSGGEQQMLTIGRALMINPDLLLLDEPTAGLAPVIVKMLGEQILRLKEAGITILLSEQNAQFAMAVSDQAYIIDKGVIEFSGSIDALRGDATLRREYLAIS